MGAPPVRVTKPSLVGRSHTTVSRCQRGERSPASDGPLDLYDSTIVVSEHRSQDFWGGT